MSRARRTEAEDSLRHELGLLYSQLILERRRRGDANGHGRRRLSRR